MGDVVFVMAYIFEVSSTSTYLPKGVHNATEKCIVKKRNNDGGYNVLLDLNVSTEEV